MLNVKRMALRARAIMHAVHAMGLEPDNDMVDALLIVAATIVRDGTGTSTWAAFTIRAGNAWVAAPKVAEQVLKDEPT